MKHLFLISAVLVLFALPLLAVPASPGITLTLDPQTGQLSVAWEPHPQAAQLAEFRFYHTLTSGVYAGAPVATFTPGTATTGSIPAPTVLGRHYYTLTAVWIQGGVTLESDRSNEVNYDVRPEKPTLRSIVQQAMEGMKKAGQDLIALAESLLLELEKVPDVP